MILNSHTHATIKAYIQNAPASLRTVFGYVLNRLKRGATPLSPAEVYHPAGIPDQGEWKRILNTPDFQAAFIHGISIWSGALVGLLVWAIFQQTPVDPPYRYILDLTPPTTEEGTSAKTEETTIPQDTKHQDTGHDTPVTAAPEKFSVPLPGLTEQHAKYGDLPIIRKSDHLRPFDAYRHPFAKDNLSKPLIAVVMMDYGLSEQGSDGILGVLPSGVNLLLSTAARDTRAWVQKAYDHGHEVWLQLALEPPDYPASDPGAHALMTAGSIESNQDALLAQLGHAVGYAGVFSPLPSPYFLSGADADFAANAMFDRGLGLMINASTTSPIVRNAALDSKAPFYMGDMIVAADPRLYPDAFAKAEAQAQKNGFAIIVFSPLPFAQKKMLDWTGQLTARGFSLAPLSIISERGKDLSR